MSDQEPSPAQNPVVDPTGQWRWDGTQWVTNTPVPPMWAAPPPSTRRRQFPRWAWIAAAVAAIVVIAGVSVALAASSNNTHAKARAAASSAASAAHASSAAQSASAAAQAEAESLAAAESSAAQAASQSAAAAASNLRSGETASLTSTGDDGSSSGFTMTVVIHRNAQPSGDYTMAPTKGQYVVADVTIKVTSGSYHYNSYDFQAQSGNGQIWQPAFAIGFDPTLNDGTASAGQVARGNIVFDVPAGPIQIQLTGGVGRSAAAAWNG